MTTKSCISLFKNGTCYQKNYLHVLQAPVNESKNWEAYELPYNISTTVNSLYDEGSGYMLS